MSLPTDLTVNDAGFLLQVVDYGHLMRWNGTIWEFAPGDSGNGYIRDCVVPPQDEGWVICDGRVTSYLKSGSATLFATPFTTPNELGSGVYHRSTGVYSGSIEDAIAPTLSGSTDTEAAHTHSVNPPSTTSGNDSGAGTVVAAGVGTTVATHTHTHDTDIAAVTSAAGSAHSHTVAALVVTDGGEPFHLGVLRYFRR